MEIFYHGSNAGFEQFDLTFNEKADTKGGYGVHFTSDMDSAIEYAKKKARRVPEHFIYTVELPEITSANCLIDKLPVAPAITAAASAKLGAEFSAKILADGTAFRKFIAKKLTGDTKVTLEGEKIAAEFLTAIGVEFIQWKPQSKDYSGMNVTILDPSKIKIASVESVDGGSFYSIAKFIKKFYQEYWGVQTYDADKCIAFSETSGKWGTLGNFAHTAIQINGYEFQSSETLFQLMKFRDKKVILSILNNMTARGKRCCQIKKTAKSYEKEYRREDWGEMIVDAMKYCLQKKYEQSEEFRKVLGQTQGFFIVEDQTSFPKTTADTWGAKLINRQFVGPNLMGRLLMELRDNGMLEYELPEDALGFIEFLK